MTVPAHNTNFNATQPKKAKPKSKNNFRDPNVLAKVQYRAWLKIKPEYQANYGGKQIIIRNGFITKKDFGLDSLIKLIDSMKNQLQVGIIYYRPTNTSVYQFKDFTK